MHNPLRYFNCSSEVIRLTVMMDIRYPLSPRQIEDVLFERGIDICHETVRLWWNRLGPLFGAEIRQRRVHDASYPRWRWPLDEVFVRISGVMSAISAYGTDRVDCVTGGVHTNEDETEIYEFESQR